MMFISGILDGQAVQIELQQKKVGADMHIKDQNMLNMLICGSEGNSIRYLSVAPRTNDMK